MRHDDRARPWIVAIHGAGAGEPLDLLWMGSVRAHRRLPRQRDERRSAEHGPRSRTPSDYRFPGSDVLVNLYGLAQAMSDIRAAARWTRAQGATAIAVHGISLGSYAAALLAGLEPTSIVSLPDTSRRYCRARTVPCHALRARRARGDGTDT